MSRKAKNAAIRLNNEANVCYKNRQPRDAVQLYTKAIGLPLPPVAIGGSALTSNPPWPSFP